MEKQNQGKVVSDVSDHKDSRSTDQATHGISNTPQPANLSGVPRPFSPRRFLLITLGGIFLAEVVAMIFVYSFQHLPYYVRTIIDASVMIIMIFPLVYFFSLKPLIRHIEKQQQQEKALRQSEERFTKAFHSSPAALSITRGMDGGFIDVNKSFLHLAGYSREEVIGHTSIELGMYANPEVRAELRDQTLRQQLLAEEGVRAYEMEARLKSGEIRTILVSTEGIELDSEPCILTSISDITERKQAEEVVETERQRFYDVLETLPAYLVLLTPDYHVPFSNRFFRERFGESQGRRCYEYLFGRNEPCEICETYKVLNTMAPGKWEWTGPDGRIYDVFDYPFTDTDGSTLILEMGIDITEQKQAEAQLRRVNHALSVLNDCNQALVRAENETELLQKMCEIIVNTGKYRMAWVGFAEQDQARSVRPAAQYGFEDGYLGLAQITWADNERGRGPTGTAIRQGVVQVNQNFLTNPNMTPWRESALLRGYQSSIALPLQDESSTFGALTIYSPSPDAFDEEEVHLLNELADNLAFGTTALRLRAERNRAQEQVREMALFPALNPNAVVRVDATGRINMANQAAEQMGLCVGAQLTDVIPDLRDLDMAFCIATGTTQQVQETQLGERVLQWTIRGVPELGLAFLYSTDITLPKQAEDMNRQLSRIVEQTEDTVVVTNRDGMIEYVNPAFERLTGYTKEEALGKTSRVIKSGVHDDGFYRNLWNTILKGDVFQSEITNRKKNGELHHEVKTITPLRDTQGNITHFVATGKDITQHKHDEEELRKAYDELELRVQNRTEELRIANSELEEEIIERKRIETEIQRYAEELRSKNEALTRFNRAMVGRELRMIELKKEVNELYGQAGQLPRYPLDFEKEGL